MSAFWLNAFALLDPCLHILCSDALADVLQAEYVLLKVYCCLWVPLSFYHSALCLPASLPPTEPNTK